MSSWIASLARKWHEIPVGAGKRRSSTEILRLSDAGLLTWFEQYESDKHEFLDWTVEVYLDFVRGKKIIEIGPGAGFPGVQFLQAGPRITFMDVAESNLMLIERVCRLKNIDGASFLPIHDFSDPLKVPDDHDAIFAIGSLHHTPANVEKPEFEALASRIRIGGRFIALTYPRERWIKEGRKPFSEWGMGTDGETTPWAEWYDTDKFLAQLSSYTFRTLMAFNFHNDDFNWFDLQRVG